LLSRYDLCALLVLVASSEEKPLTAKNANNCRKGRGEKREGFRLLGWLGSGRWFLEQLGIDGWIDLDGVVLHYAGIFTVLFVLVEIR
jgi:hypothetical protein